MSKKKKCDAITKKGKRCKRLALDGKSHCAIHSGGTTAGAREPYKFDDTKRAKYLELLKAGMNRGNAAASVGVTRQCVHEYRKKDADFVIDESTSEMQADGVVEAGLFAKAIGKGQGAVIASIFWLKNRQPDKWSDVKEIHVLERLKAEERGKLEAALIAAGVTDDQLSIVNAVLNGEDAADAPSGAIH